MKILVLTSSFPRFEGDIAGCFVEDHCLQLCEQGHQVQVLCWSEDTRDSRSIGQRLRVDWIRYAPDGGGGIFFQDGAPENLEANPGRIAWVAPALATMFGHALIHAANADLIIGHWLVPGGFVARLVGRLTGKPSLVIGHSGGVHALAKLPRPLGKPLASYITQGPTSVSSVALKTKLGGLCDVAHVQVRSMGFHPERNLQARERTNQAVTMGRLVPIKNIELAIRAVEKSTHCTHLHILGDGTDRERLQALANPERVTFHGIVRGEQKHTLLAQSRLSLFPSVHQNARHEGLPVSLLECAHAGATPVIGVIPGAKDLLVDPRFQQPPMHADSWAEAMDILLTRAHCAVTPKLAQAYTWDILGPRWCEWIEQVAENQR